MPIIYSACHLNRSKYSRNTSAKPSNFFISDYVKGAFSNFRS